MRTKSILASKTFWANVLGAGAQLVNSGVLQVVDPAVLVVIQAVLNVAVRAVTAAPVSLFGDE